MRKFAKHLAQDRRISTCRASGMFSTIPGGCPAITNGEFLAGMRTDLTPPLEQLHRGTPRSWVFCEHCCVVDRWHWCRSSLVGNGRIERYAASVATLRRAWTQRRDVADPSWAGRRIVVN
jgi:hypothetical protein